MDQYLCRYNACIHSGVVDYIRIITFRPLPPWPRESSVFETLHHDTSQQTQCYLYSPPHPTEFRNTQNCHTIPEPDLGTKEVIRYRGDSRKNKQTNISAHDKACKLLSSVLWTMSHKVLLNGHINICLLIVQLCIG